MKSFFFRAIALPAILLSGVAGLSGASLILIPPSLTAPPLGTVGWGFSITNDSPTDWIEITSSQFCIPPFTLTPAVACPNAPTLGTYFDRIAANDVIIAPGATVTQAFDLAGTSGLGYFVVSPGVTSGTDVGQIVVTYDLYLGNPNDGGLQLFPPGGITPLTADASVTVISGIEVPEPATLAISALALTWILVVRKRT